MLDKMKRIYRYFAISFVMDLKSNIAYPSTFWFAVTTIPLWGLLQILLIEMIYGQTNSFLGYTKYENYVLFGTWQLVQSLAIFFFSVRLEDLSEKVRGTSDWSLDMMLLKPLDSQLFATTGKYWLGVTSSIMVGIGLIVYGLIHEPHAISIIQIITYLWTMGLGIFLLYLIYLFIQTWLFWFEYLEVGESLWFAFQSFGEYPRQLYHGGLGIVLNIVIPITLMASVPVELLFGKMPLYMLGVYTLIVAILFGLTRWFWQYSIKKYSSFSS
jgi:ABC-2 type transport system permease protein